ncbi:TolC family protein [Sphingobium sp. B2]|uniref:TolC family protein n=1 Tax=Sphingobium sp. B2 TaxID=2583228 RepID=UPI0011AA67F1|nr:TolC family protein [Sphingobium sp. B2]
MRHISLTSICSALLCGAAQGAWAQGEGVPAPREAPLVFVSPRPVAAGETPAPTEIRNLAQAIRLVYWSNPSLLAQRATVRSSDNRYPAARAAYGLTLSAEGSHAYQRDRFNTLLGWAGNQGWASTASAILNQPLFTFGRSAGGERVALAQVAFARDTLRLVETQILLDTINSYIAVIRDREAVVIAQENLGLLDRQLNESRARYEVRDITDSDWRQIETRVELGRAQLLLAEGQLSGSEAQFVQLVGVRPGELTPPVELVVPFTSIEQAYDLGDSHSPVIRAAQSREKISRASTTALRAEFGPRVDLRGTASYGTVSSYSNDLRSTQLRGEVVLSMPLLDGNLRLSRLREAEEANASDWRLIDQSVRETHATIGSSWQQLVLTRKSLVNYSRAVEAARQAYNGAVEQEIAGDRTKLDVLDLARDLLNVRIGYISAQANEYIFRAALLAAIDGLNASQLVPDIQRYDPTDHFDKVRGRGDLPLITDRLSGLDRITGGDISTDRPVRDAVAAVRLAPAAPMPLPE